MPQSREAGTAGPHHEERFARLAEEVLRCLIEDFEEHGKDAVARMRESDPKAYVGLVVRLLPAASHDGDGSVLVKTLIDLGGGHG